MVVSLGPGKFYGSSLPRPWIYTDVKLSEERVDPPVSALDPLLAWANEAHWSMGGLSFKRLRHQGRIEGSVKKLQAEREVVARKKKKRLAKFSRSTDDKVSQGKVRTSNRRAASLTPPPAPITAKRRKYMSVSDEEDDSEEEEATLVMAEEESETEFSEDEQLIVTKKKMPVRKLYDEFNKVARESKSVVGESVMEVVGDLNKEPNEEVVKKRKAKIVRSTAGTRTSPRFGK